MKLQILSTISAATAALAHPNEWKPPGPDDC